jgi:hypothetical protein
MEVTFQVYLNFVAVVDLLAKVPVPHPDFQYMKCNLFKNLAYDHLHNDRRFTKTFFPFIKPHVLL